MNSPLHRRRSIRLQGYNYSEAGAYFVTICTQDRQCLFGEIQDGQVVLNAAGSMVADSWNRLPSRFPEVELDVSVVMPNHFHGILVLAGDGLSLPDVVQRFKSITTRLYTLAVAEKGWQPFRGRVWQRNYFEHIVRSPKELDELRQYITNNPMQWELDSENPRRSER